MSSKDLKATRRAGFIKEINTALRKYTTNGVTFVLLASHASNYVEDAIDKNKVILQRVEKDTLHDLELRLTPTGVLSVSDLTARTSSRSISALDTDDLLDLLGAITGSTEFDIAAARRDREALLQTVLAKQPATLIAEIDTLKTSVVLFLTQKLDELALSQRDLKDPVLVLSEFDSAESWSRFINGATDDEVRELREGGWEIGEDAHGNMRSSRLFTKSNEDFTVEDEDGQADSITMWDPLHHELVSVSEIGYSLNKLSLSKLQELLTILNNGFEDISLRIKSQGVKKFKKA